MAYVLNKTNGAVLTTISNGSIDQTTDLIFVGKNYAGYGQAINEDLLKLLENFSSGVAPLKPLTGQIWYDSASKRIKFYNGTTFLSLQNTQVATTEPGHANYTVGDFWWDTANNVLKVFDGVSFIVVGPIDPLIAPHFKFSVIQDISNQNHNVTEHTIPSILTAGSNLVAVMSNDDFYPIVGASLDDLIYDDNWPYIRKGLTLKNANPLTGVSSDGTEGTTLLWGTAADAIRVNGYTASKSAILNTVVIRDAAGDITANAFYGLITTATNALTLWNVDASAFQQAHNTAAINSIVARDVSGDVFVNVLHGTATQSNFLYNVDSTTYQNASSSNIVNNIVARDLHGNFIVNRGTFGQDIVVPMITKSGSTGVGDIGSVGNTFNTVYATVFNGVATSARYADLAERYHADAVYDEGTVLVIGGLSEVTVTDEHANVTVAGIVSKKPAFMMNSEAGTDDSHPYIALKGRVPCKVVGTVLKGDILVTSTTPGYACAADIKYAIHPAAIIGKALESNSQGFGLIEVKV